VGGGAGDEIFERTEDIRQKTKDKRPGGKEDGKRRLRIEGQNVFQMSFFTFGH
jgi:hypothetical protein